jgi:hypothetical protein
MAVVDKKHPITYIMKYIEIQCVFVYSQRPRPREFEQRRNLDYQRGMSSGI